MAGKKYSDWRVADKLVHSTQHRVTEEENRTMTLITCNPQPLHLDPEYAAKTEFGQIVVNGLFTFALMVGVSVEDTTLGTLVANLGYDKVTMPKPVFIGDRLGFETEVVDLRESRSRPNAGIVTFRHRAINQRGEVVCECLRTALVMK